MEETRCPVGYPLRLFFVKGNYVLGPSKFEVMKRLSTSDVYLVNILTLIGTHGHSGAHKLLKELGPKWMTKEGRVYFPL